MQAMKLVCVSESNNNKFINVVANVDGNSFTAEWGRVGAKASSTVYPASDFDRYIKSKLKKGYVNCTDYVKEITSTKQWDIKNPTILSLIEFLISSAKQKIDESYTIGVGSVTQKQIDKAQEILDGLMVFKDGFSKASISSVNSLYTINSLLKELYTILPRKMNDTRRHFLKEMNEAFFIELLQQEQNLLDTLKGQVSFQQTEVINLNLAQFNLNIEEANQTDRDLILSSTDFRLGHNQKVFKITNAITEKAFNPKKLKTKLLYHGSKNFCFWSILTAGLKIKPKGIPTTGSMFSVGAYFANKAKKSIGYTSISSAWSSRGNGKKGYLAIFEVATGKPWYVLGKNGEKFYESWMSYDIPNRLGSYDCAFAKAGSSIYNDEVIVYNPNQATIRYLIELKE